MKNILVAFLFIISSAAIAQNNGNLTVEKIMKDQNWVGTSPSNVSWSWDSKSIFFNWNPDKNVMDSFYIFKLNGKQPEKLNYNEAQLLRAINGGQYNKNYSKITYSYKGDIFILNTLNGAITPITQTEDIESSPKFIANDEWVVYSKNKNLYGWQIKTGFTKQLTNFVKELDKTPRANMNAQDLFLQKQALANSEILRSRKQKRMARDAFMELVKVKPFVKPIAVGEKQIRDVQASESGEYIVYTLFTPEVSKNTIVPSYVTENGYTTDIPGRENVGIAQGTYETFVYNKNLDTVYAIKLDSIPGSTDKPAYLKDYPNRKDAKPYARKLWIADINWN